MKYQYEVETIESGQRKSYGDSYYHYKVTSNRPEYEVKKFCMNVLKKRILSLLDREIEKSDKQLKRLSVGCDDKPTQILNEIDKLGIIDNKASFIKYKGEVLKR